MMSHGSIGSGPITPTLPLCGGNQLIPLYFNC
jgi:hypothetical protein